MNETSSNKTKDNTNTDNNNRLDDFIIKTLVEDANCTDKNQYIKASYDPVTILSEIRRYAKHYHPITNQQYGEFYKNLDESEHDAEFYEATKKIIEEENIQRIIGWNAGMLFPEKPYFVIAWRAKNGKRYVEFVVSDKDIENCSVAGMLAVLAAKKILHMSKSLVKSILADDYSKIRGSILHEANNGDFFQIIIETSDSDSRHVNCFTQLFPIERLTQLNKSWRKLPKKYAESQETRIDESVFSDTINKLLAMRTRKHRFFPISKRQYLNPDEDFAAIIKNSNKKYPKDNPNGRFYIGEYNAETIAVAYTRALKANDIKAANSLKDTLSEITEKTDSYRPNITVKKILGWNAGYLTPDKGKNIPWFSTCWEDKKGHIMMDVLFNAVPNLQLNNDLEVNRLCEKNYIYRKNNNFITVLPQEDNDNYTFYVDKICEDENVFWRVIIMLKFDEKSPKICEAAFCPNEKLVTLNSRVNILNDRVADVITKRIELTNDTLHDIDMDNLMLLYYDEHHDNIFAITKNKDAKNNFVEKSKNIFVQQVSYTEYSAIYGTEKLLPDCLLDTFDRFLDNQKIRNEYNNKAACFAFDGLNGWGNIDDWSYINHEKAGHIFLNPDFSEKFLDKINAFLEEAFYTEALFNNFESDLRSCWKNIVADYLGRKKPMKVRPISPLDEIKYYDIIVFSETNDDNPYFELTVKNNGKIKIYSTETNSEVTKVLKKFSENNVHFKNWWRDFRDGTGKSIMIDEQYYDRIFTMSRLRHGFTDLKLTQINNNNPNKLCSMIVRNWQFFFDPNEG